MRRAAWAQGIRAVENRSGSMSTVAGANPLAYLSEQLEAWREAGSYFRLRELQSPCEPVSVFDGREVINLASNNYLGLANDPRLVEASIAAARNYGAGSGAV